MRFDRPHQAIGLKAKLFRGFADPSRLAILDSLRAGSRTVTEIIETTGLTQSNVSNHLGCLRDCGLVISAQQGRYVQCELSDPATRRCCIWRMSCWRTWQRVSMSVRAIRFPSQRSSRHPHDQPHR